MRKRKLIRRLRGSSNYQKNKNAFLNFSKTIKTEVFKKSVKSKD